jgi:hypothetical protein
VARTSGPCYRSESSILDVLDESALDTRLEMLQMLGSILLGSALTQYNAVALAHALVAGSPWSPADGKNSEIHHLYSYVRYIALPMAGYGTLPEGVQKKYENEVIGLNGFISAIAYLLEAEGAQYSSVEDPMTPQEQNMAVKMFEFIKCHGRTFCITEQGRICTVATAAREGDVLAAFEGSDRFFALRQSSRLPHSEGKTRYIVVGDSWVYGLMHGEAYEGLEPDDVDEDIELV